LELEITKSNEGIHLCQRKYTLDILTEIGMFGSEPCTTPLMSNNRILFENAEKLQNSKSYRRLIRKLLYMTNTRPDITFGVHLLSQFLQEPIIHHQQVIQHVLRYIKGNPAKGLFFSANNKMQVKTFSDSDWTSCPETRQSTIGYYIFLGDSLIF